MSPCYAGPVTISIALLAFPGSMQSLAKIGVLTDSFLSGLHGYCVLRLAMRALQFTSTHEVNDESEWTYNASISGELFR